MRVNPREGPWSTNAVLNGRAFHYATPPTEGTLSIKSVIHGHGEWITDTGRFPMSPGRYLVLNNGSRYSVEILSKELVETFCVFFRPGFVEACKAAIACNAPQLLEPVTLRPAAGFHERINPMDGLLAAPMESLISLVSHGDYEDWEAEESVLRIAEALLAEQSEAVRGEARLDASRASTREEIYRRLSLARDFMLSNLDKEVDLEAVASAAFLSPFHFHRLFKKAFLTTPHAFITRERMKLASSLLAKDDCSVSEVCAAAGYDSLPTFCRKFKQLAGITPAEFRRRQAG